MKLNFSWAYLNQGINTDLWWTNQISDMSLKTWTKLS
jgi:hypothetical protein